MLGKQHSYGHRGTQLTRYARDTGRPVASGRTAPRGCPHRRCPPPKLARPAAPDGRLRRVRSVRHRRRLPVRRPGPGLGHLGRLRLRRGAGHAVVLAQPPGADGRRRRLGGAGRARAAALAVGRLPARGRDGGHRQVGGPAAAPRVALPGRRPGHRLAVLQPLPPGHDAVRPAERGRPRRPGGQLRGVDRDRHGDPARRGVLDRDEAPGLRRAAGHRGRRGLAGGGAQPGRDHHRPAGAGADPAGPGPGRAARGVPGPRPG